ncbi:hypothetical protein Q73_03305 [Bacillus coahuilensis m2-6]|uniref:flavin reductase family protein n=1 Tax=Bacillus coahuilensis TaxID=408580 RepID=UPI00075035B1|nr:flavin reductase family protein [Bacillus coahuilensis]KUP09315.1 hypothetical protein Q73_03305 [Bacillus coahuilensis m2-6]
MNIRPEELVWNERYKLLIGSILPRPIAFVSTINDNGESNLAPFSFYTAICADPMLVCFSPMRNGVSGEKKDTLKNIEETNEFVINVVSGDIVERMNVTAQNVPGGVDEFDLAGLTKKKSSMVSAYRVGESKVSLECVLHDLHHYGDVPGSGSLVVGRVVAAHIDEAAFDSGRIRTEVLKPIGRMAGQVYTNPLAEMFNLERKS